MKSLMKNVLIFLVLLSASPAFTQGGDHLKLTTVVQKERLVESDTGEQTTELVAADKVLPGDSVVYITFENVGNESAENVTITNPVPQNLTYEVGSAFGPGAVIEFSVDGGSVFGLADELTIAENGEVRRAQAEDYTHIRWVMRNDLPAGEQGTARFRAQLN